MGEELARRALREAADPSNGKIAFTTRDGPRFRAVARCLWLLEAPQNKAVGNKAIVALCEALLAGCSLTELSLHSNALCGVATLRLEPCASIRACR